MKLTRLNIIKADTCGGLLDGLKIPFREGKVDTRVFTPLCLIGPNGTGKSQVLQIIAEIFQAIFKKYIPDEEKGTPNESIFFEIEYQIAKSNGKHEKIKAYRYKPEKKKTGEIVFEIEIDGVFQIIEDDNDVIALLPSKVVGYTSGDNETLSIPFLVSRSGYANQVRTSALNKESKSQIIHDSRMLLIDYSTNLEVLVANLLLNPSNVREKLIEAPNLKTLNSFRCVIQLNHSAAPTGGVKLTDELEQSIEYLKSCATCHDYVKKTATYTFDFLVQNSTHKAFDNFWSDGSLELYSCFHKLAMLNDLIIPKKDREAFDKGIKERRFAAALPEPMERQKVFRFERVEFTTNKMDTTVDYVSLSDGEHQLAQLLGTMCMINYPNVLLLLDEPESHFNPRWRIEFISKVLHLETSNGIRYDDTLVAQQECLLTTHSPFVPSDMKSDNVLIFKKSHEKGNITVTRPHIETFGSTFDTILEECFEISPTMSDIPKNEINHLMKSENIEEIRSAIKGFGDSVERMYLAERIRMLKKKESL
jgi:restriction system-associated AAA family ATPase